jgi:hypothetical protein
MYYDSGRRLSTEVGSDAVMGPTTPYGSRVSSIKISLTESHVQLDTHVPNAHTHVLKASDGRAIMDLNDVRTDNAINACKACGRTATVRLQCNVGTMDHSSSTRYSVKRLDSTTPHC